MTNISRRNKLAIIAGLTATILLFTYPSSLARTSSTTMINLGDDHPDDYLFPSMLDKVKTDTITFTYGSIKDKQVVATFDNPNKENWLESKINQLFMFAYSLIQPKNSASASSTYTVEATDQPGNWWESVCAINVGPQVCIISIGDSLKVIMGDKTASLHTFSTAVAVDSAGAPGGPEILDQEPWQGAKVFQFNNEAAYVMACKVHPFMLLTLVVDDPSNGFGFPELTPLLSPPTDATNLITFGTDDWVRHAANDLKNPSKSGVGEVWVDTQYEILAPGTIGSSTVIDTSDWSIKNKIAGKNNPHNMWANRNLDRVYNTQWFEDDVRVIDRATGDLQADFRVGWDPAHVITSPVTDKAYVSINGEANIDVIDPTNLQGRTLPIGGVSPHALWISHDGKTLITPNAQSNTASVIDIQTEKVLAVIPVSTLPIASSITPDGKRAYVANFLGESLSVIDLDSGSPTYLTVIATVDLGGSIAGFQLPIQTPVSPDGKHVVTALTTIFAPPEVVITDTSTNTVVKRLPCEAGCHGVNFGAKKGGGYYAYVTAKFSNALTVIDMDTLKVAGKVFLGGGPGDELGGMGGQGVLPIPIMYNGWIQSTIASCAAAPSPCSGEVNGFLGALGTEQKDPNGPATPP